MTGGQSRNGGASFDALNLGFAERLYLRFLEDERSVSERWRRLFRDLPGERPGPRAPSFPSSSVFAGADGDGRLSDVVLRERVERLVRSFLAMGHRAAAVDPLEQRPAEPEELDPRFHRLRGAALDRTIPYGIGRDLTRRPVRWILRHLRESYCGPIGVEFVHVRDGRARSWIRRRMEMHEGEERPDRCERLRMFRRLTDAAVFEEFVRKKFVGSKSYSLEGAESLLLFLDAVVDGAAEQEVDEIVLAMTHRGRLDVLANLLDKPTRRLFRELRDDCLRDQGDLRHHLGASTDRRGACGRRVHLSLCFNPSHLEFVGPIALGRTRAKQDREGDRAGRRGMAVVVHGDAAFAGEGVVHELFNLSRLPAYDVGGSVHVVVDNQIGFTTPPEEGRSSEYATDPALMLGVPILHVNADEPESVVRAGAMAMDFRRRFRRDVVVDLRCYRRFGHNEVDEPRFTQPGMYSLIDERPSVRDSYLERLTEDGLLSRSEAKRAWEDRWDGLEEELDALDDDPDHVEETVEPRGVWKGYRGGPVARREAVPTGVARTRLSELLESIARVPEGFRAHGKLEKLLEARRAMARGERELDWAAAEALAFASLATAGVPVRLTGQDSARGTFSQRHATLFDQKTGERYDVFSHLANDQEPVEIRNSPLSELGVLGFEYGYSLDSPSTLVLWEAQFGDFANAAQVVIDQFIASAEDKWRRLSGIVLLLPHGFEGQGPEHSSARPERYLQAAAEDNLQLVQPSTPAQLFHLLRRQALQRWKKPLVVLTPKSLLRHARCTSGLDELDRGGFRAVLGDPRASEDPDRVLLCSGKLFYELEEEREERGRDDVAIVRLEETYPFPERELEEALGAYPDETPVIWVQEEPENMGAWRHLRSRFPQRIVGRFPFRGVHRPASASPASGSAACHREQQEGLRRRAFEGRP